MVPAWKTQWQKSPKSWVDFPNSLVDVMKTFKNIKEKVPMLQKYAKEVSKLKDMPWLKIAREIANGVNRKDERFSSADNMMPIEKLRPYVEIWRTECQTVNTLIQWKLFGEDGATKLAILSRPGAYDQPCVC